MPVIDLVGVILVVIELVGDTLGVGDEDCVFVADKLIECEAVEEGLLDGDSLMVGLVDTEVVGV